MTLEDTRNLFVQLLSKHFVNHPKLRDSEQIPRYHEVLEPYAPADVKAAVLQCLREKSFFPDPSEIAAHCPIPAVQTRTGPSQKEIQDLRNLHRELQERGWFD